MTPVKRPKPRRPLARKPLAIVHDLRRWLDVLEVELLRSTGVRLRLDSHRKLTQELGRSLRRRSLSQGSAKGR